MTGCCVVGCNNNSEKGFSLRRFPSNEERRTLWVSKIGRKNWKPSPNSHICEVHFAEDMWEKPRIDGKRKLKHNAVPTIFPIVQKEKENKENPSHTVSHFQELHKTSIISDISEETCTTQRYNMEQDTEQINIQERSIQFHDASATSKSDDGELSLAGSALLEIEELKRKLNEANKKLHVANVVIHKAEKTNRNLLQRIRKLKRFRIEKKFVKILRNTT
ncbi:uncharacterized protein LOC143899402 [Temnothorax americanus]|uniref:uncharacterized protein LOC143899402 n=1 Tax=Temnothorax americanus TaxID=1964332 RepID=UPI004068C7AB